MSTTQKVNLAYLVSHPIQYQAPLLKQLAAESDVNLIVFFRSDFSLRTYQDEGFGHTVKWDVPLLDGYQHCFLPCFGSNRKFSFFRPFNYGLKKLLKQHNIDVLWMHGYADWFLWRAIKLANSLGVKVMVRGESTLFACDQSWFKSLFRKKMLAWLNRRVNAFLAIGSDNKDFYSAYHVPSEKIFLSPYTVDNDFFRQQAKASASKISQLKNQLDLKDGVPIILYASKLTSRKHADHLLEAYIKLSINGAAPNAYLLVVGDGELKSTLVAQVKPFSAWNTIKFLGFKNQSELPVYYKLSDVLVLPSQREPWGLVVNEAMNAECAIVASDEVGSAADLIENGVNGYMFKAGNVGQLSQSLACLIADKTKLDKMKAVSADKINAWGFHETIAGIKQAIHKVLGQDEKN